MPVISAIGPARALSPTSHPSAVVPVGSTTCPMRVASVVAVAATSLLTTRLATSTIGNGGAPFLRRWHLLRRLEEKVVPGRTMDHSSAELLPHGVRAARKMDPAPLVVNSRNVSPPPQSGITSGERGCVPTFPHPSPLLLLLPLPSQ